MKQTATLLRHVTTESNRLCTKQLPVTTQAIDAHLIFQRAFVTSTHHKTISTYSRSLGFKSYQKRSNTSFKQYSNHLSRQLTILNNITNDRNNKDSLNDSNPIFSISKHKYASEAQAQAKAQRSKYVDVDPPQTVVVRKPGILNRILRRFALGPIVRGIIERTGVVTDPLLMPLLSSTITTGLYAFLIITMANKFDIDTTPFVAGFSVAGAAIGFGMKDIAYNYVAGILIATEGLCKFGDMVTVGGSYKGTVKSMNLRHLELRLHNDSSEYKNETIFIPNSTVFDKPIVVHRRANRAEFTWNKHKLFNKVAKGNTVVKSRRRWIVADKK